MRDFGSRVFGLALRRGTYEVIESIWMPAKTSSSGSPSAALLRREEEEEEEEEGLGAILRGLPV